VGLIELLDWTELWGTWIFKVDQMMERMMANQATSGTKGSDEESRGCGISTATAISVVDKV
jgi:hypothetical protein